MAETALARAAGRKRPWNSCEGYDWHLAYC